MGRPGAKGGGCLTTVSATRLSVSIGIGQPRVTSLVVVVPRGRTATFVVYSRVVTRFYVPCFLFCCFSFFFFLHFSSLAWFRGTRASSSQDVDRDASHRDEREREREREKIRSPPRRESVDRVLSRRSLLPRQKGKRGV